MKRLIPAVLIGLSAFACGDSTGPGLDSASLTIVSGDGQVGLQTTVLPLPVVIEVVRRNGEPVVGARLTLTTGPGSGRVLGSDFVTDESGRVEFQWELGEAYENLVVVRLLENQSEFATARAQARYLYLVPEDVSDGWETDSLASVNMDVEPLTRMMDRIRAGSYEEVHSVVIIKDGKLVFEEYFPGHDTGYSNPDFLGDWVDFDRDTRHNTHSATKSFASSLVGIALDQGLIPDVDQTVFSYFDEYSSVNEGGKDAITIEHLLTMTSGLAWHGDVPTGGEPTSIELFNAAGDPSYYVLSQPLVHEPGTVFNYSGGTVNILCRIVEKASGEPVDSFAHRNLFSPLGVTNYNFPRHRTGQVICHGDIYITPRDMAKFGSLFLNRGVWQGQRIISEEWIDRSVAPAVSLAPLHLSWADDYGYLWWLKEYHVGGADFPSFKALGWGGQEIMVFPQSDLVVVFTGANYTRDPPCDELVTRYILPALGE